VKKIDVSLFPLVNMCLFPGTTKPLNIFEPRYLQMVRDSIAQNVPLALAFIESIESVRPHSPGENLSYVREVAGYGYARIIQERLNGTMLVFVQCEGKVKLGPLKSSTSPYLTVEAEVIEEDQFIDKPSERSVHVLNQILARWIQNHIPDPEQKKLFMNSLTGPQEIVGAFATYLVRDYDLQQMILEMNSLSKKIQTLHRLVESNEVIT
jgi:Lon protease-like protein